VFITSPPDAMAVGMSTMSMPPPICPIPNLAMAARMSFIALLMWRFWAAVAGKDMALASAQFAAVIDLVADTSAFFVVGQTGILYTYGTLFSLPATTKRL